MTISPRVHANAYATLGAGSVASFLIYEGNVRLGIDWNPAEEGMIVTIVAAAYVFFGRRFRKEDA